MTITRKFWFWLLVVCAVLALGVFISSSLRRIEVKGYEVSRKELVISVTSTSTGTIKSDSELKLTAQRIGRITRLPVEEGTQVAKGGLIAELDPEEALQRQHAADANLRRIKAGLDAMKLNFASFSADVDAGIARAESVVTETEARYRRLHELRNKGYLAAVDLDAVRKELDVAKATYKAALVSRELIKSKEQEIKAQAAALEQAASELELARIYYEYSFIRSGIAGYVTARPVKLGETLIVGSPVASVVSWNSLYIEAFIDEADVAKVKIGQPVNVTMDAYQGRVFKGEVYMISPVVLGGKQEARTFEVRVRLIDREMAVKPGMSADVEVEVERKPGLLLVPSQAVVEKNDARYLYVVRKGKALRQAVKTGTYNWSFTEITEGISEGDLVVTTPDASGLAEGVRVSVTRAK